MSDAGVLQDRDELRRAAIARTRRLRWITVGGAAAVLLAAPALLLPFRGDVPVWALFAPPAVVVLFLVAVAWLSRKRDAQVPLVTGAGRPDRVAARRALRAGYATDARVDALARDMAGAVLRSRWLTWFNLAIMSIQLVLVVVRVATGDRGWSLMLNALTAACFGLAAVVLLWQQRAARRYLASTAPGFPAPGTSEGLPPAEPGFPASGSLAPGTPAAGTPELGERAPGKGSAGGA